MRVRSGWPLCVIGLTLLLRPALAAPSAAGAGERCVNFVGDISLSRAVAAQLRQRPTDPWAALPRRPGEPWIGNLEGSLQQHAGAQASQAEPQPGCRNPAGICLPIASAALESLSGAFTALSLANNHSADDSPVAATAEALRRLGITPLLEQDAPQLLELAGQRWALVPLNLINRAPADLEAALIRARLQVGLARAHTPRVAVLPHWGREYSRQPYPEEQELAARLHAWGALLILGSHSHVIGESRCRAGQATYFGLGNHLFDGPRATWEGLQVRCCEAAATLTCSALKNHRTASSFFPQPAGPAPEASCVLPLPADAPEQALWQRHRAHERFVFVQPYSSLGAGTFFALHRKYSRLDREVALRPLVFRVAAGRALDLWRGTALSRPLLAARLIKVGEEEYLCALHRGDSFLKLDPTTPKRLHVVYKWSGFGFRGVQSPAALERCRAL